MHSSEHPTEPIDLWYSQRHYAPTQTMRVPVQHRGISVRFRVVLVLLVAALVALGLADFAWYVVTGLPILGML